MKRTRLILILSLTALFCLPALLGRAEGNKEKPKPQKPDLEEIRRAVTDYNSKFYYPKLRKAYWAKDTTMTPEQFKYFYLGYMFQEDFNPYRESEFATELDSLAFKQKLTKAEFDSIISRSEKSLQDNPFDLREMSFLIFALNQKEKHMKAKLWQYRFENILNTILNTGTGDSEETAWYVISPDHEYALINVMNYTAVGYDDKTPGIDYIQVQPNVPKGKRLVGKQHDGFYFNIKKAQEEYERKFGTEEDAGDAGAEPAEVPEE